MDFITFFIFDAPWLYLRKIYVADTTRFIFEQRQWRGTVWWLATRIIRSCEALILPSVVLGENMKICEWKYLQRGGGQAPVNNSYPDPLSLCGTPPLLCMMWCYLRTDGHVYRHQEADRKSSDWTPVKVGIFLPLSTIRESGTHFSGRGTDGRKIEIKN